MNINEDFSQAAEAPLNPQQIYLRSTLDQMIVEEMKEREILEARIKEALKGIEIFVASKDIHEVF